VLPLWLLADHPNVQFNAYRGGLGTCAVEMHEPQERLSYSLHQMGVDP
jgi:hypothetical protein